MTADFKQTNSTVRYQLIVGIEGTDHEHSYALRDTWEEAADDAVNAGEAEWESQHVLKLKDGAQIKRIRE